ITTTLLLGVVVVVALALIWSWVLVQDWSADNSWVLIIELVVFAALVGLAIGLLANNAKPSTLWVAAGLTIVGLAFAYSLMEMGAYPAEYGIGLDDSILGSLMGTELVGNVDAPISVSAGQVVLAIIAAACAAIGSRTKDILSK
ncbi:MAG: hypothetical protein MUP36_04335, partial [Demequinaceae bacterium]|nr:hypothetical protein [Demequinaceae bacterium]